MRPWAHISTVYRLFSFRRFLKRISSNLAFERQTTCATPYSLSRSTQRHQNIGQNRHEITAEEGLRGKAGGGPSGEGGARCFRREMSSPRVYVHHSMISHTPNHHAVKSSPAPNHLNTLSTVYFDSFNLPGLHNQVAESLPNRKMNWKTK